MQPLEINKGDKVKWVFYHHIEESTTVGPLGENDYSTNRIAHESSIVIKWGYCSLFVEQLLHCLVEWVDSRLVILIGQSWCPLSSSHTLIASSLQLVKVLLFCTQCRAIWLVVFKFDLLDALYSLVDTFIMRSRFSVLGDWYIEGPRTLDASNVVIDMIYNVLPFSSG